MSKVKTVKVPIIVGLILFKVSPQSPALQAPVIVAAIVPLKNASLPVFKASIPSSLN